VASIAPGLSGTPQPRGRRMSSGCTTRAVARMVTGRGPRTAPSGGVSTPSDVFAVRGGSTGRDPANLRIVREDRPKPRFQDERADLAAANREMIRRCRMEVVAEGGFEPPTKGL